MPAFPRPPLTFAPPLIVTACALLCVGCGIPRHFSPRPDHDLPGGFSGTYRRGLVLAGEVPAGPTDREAFARLPGVNEDPAIKFRPLPFAAPLGPILPPTDWSPAPLAEPDAATPLFPDPLPAPVAPPVPGEGDGGAGGGPLVML